MLPNPTHVESVSTGHFVISATHLINTAYSIVVNLLTVHPASKPFYRQRWLDNKSIMLPYIPPHLFGCADFRMESLNNLNLDAEFNFRLDFSRIFDYDNFTGDVDYDGIPVSCTRDSEDALGVTSSCKKCRLNQLLVC